MGNERFRFRQFEVCQERCAMKVGTDGVLLGAWADGGKRILDIGTGTGLLSLMMAQRFPQSRLTGIDMDADACRQAAENVEASPFRDRIEIVCASLQQYACDGLFDCIVSNPPFFVNGMKNPDSRRSMARHADTLTYADLFDGVGRLLHGNGIFSVVIPSECLDRLLEEAFLHGFYPTRRIAVRTTPRKQPRRYLLSFSRESIGVVTDADVVLQQADGSRSEWYQTLTAEFYLW